MARTLFKHLSALANLHENEVLASKMCCTEISKSCTRYINVVFREVKSELKKQQIERCADVLSDGYVSVVAEELVMSVCDEVFQVDVNRLEELAEKQRQIELLRTRCWFDRWRKECAARKKLKRSMLDFPCALSLTLHKSAEKMSLGVDLLNESPIEMYRNR